MTMLGTPTSTSVTNLVAPATRLPSSVIAIAAPIPIGTEIGVAIPTVIRRPTMALAYPPPYRAGLPGGLDEERRAEYSMSCAAWLQEGYLILDFSPYADEFSDISSDAPLEETPTVD